MQTEATNLELIEEESISEQEIVNYLTAIGVNNSRRNYDGEGKAMYEAYINLPLSSIINTWDRLDPNVKLSVLETHADEFKRWVKENSDG
jgi:hypothetical protein